MQVSTADLCKIFRVTAPTIGRWVQIGCPKLKRGVFLVSDVLYWWAENIYEAKLETEEKDESLKNARQRYWKAKAEKEEINIAQLKSELIPKKKLADLWGSRVVEVKQGLLNLADRLPPILESKTQPEIRAIVHKEVVQLLNMYSRESKNTPKSLTASKSKPKKKIAKRKKTKKKK